MIDENKSVALVTDGACDLDESVFRENENLFLLPLRLIVGGECLRSGLDITTEEVLNHMENGDVPKTSLPSPEDLENIFVKLREKGIKKVLFVLISSALSGTFNMVRTVSEMYKDEFDIRIYDTKILSMGLGYQALTALRLIKEGYPFESMLEKLDELRPLTDGFFYIPTLKYLSIGGRIGGAAKYLGNLMNIKPIIACDAEGKYYPRHICIGAKRILATARGDCARFINSRPAEVTVLHAGSPDECEKLREAIQNECPTASVLTRELCPALSVHVGRGMLAVCTQVKG